MLVFAKDNINQPEHLAALCWAEIIGSRLANTGQKTRLNSLTCARYRKKDQNKNKRSVRYCKKDSIKTTQVSSKRNVCFEITQPFRYSWHFFKNMIWSLRIALFTNQLLNKAESKTPSFVYVCRKNPKRHQFWTFDVK